MRIMIQFYFLIFADYGWIWALDRGIVLWNSNFIDLGHQCIYFKEVYIPRNNFHLFQRSFWDASQVKDTLNSAHLIAMLRFKLSSGKLPSMKKLNYF